MHGHGSARGERVRSDVFGAKPSLAGPTRRHSALMTAMMLDALTEQRPRSEGKLLIGVMELHPRSRRRRKMSMPTLTGKATVESEKKW